MIKELLNIGVEKALALETGAIANKIDNKAWEGFSSIEAIIYYGLKNLIIFGAIALFFLFAYAGFQYLIAAGNSEATRKAVNTMVWGAIGLAIMLAAYTLVRFLFPEIFITSPNDLINISGND